MNDESDLEKVVAAVKESRKYGDTSEETIRQLAAEALQQHKRPKAAIKAVRKRLHSIMAPYLGDPDYAATAAALDAAFAAGDDAAVTRSLPCRAGKPSLNARAAANHGGFLPRDFSADGHAEAPAGYCLRP